MPVRFFPNDYNDRTEYFLCSIDLYRSKNYKLLNKKSSKVVKSRRRGAKKVTLTMEVLWYLLKKNLISGKK